MAVELSALLPGGLVAPASHTAACDTLARELLTRGHAVLTLSPQQYRILAAAASALQAFSARPEEERAALQPLQPVDDVGLRLLTDDREVFEYRTGPWLREDAPLPPLMAATQQLDAAARAVLPALLRSQLVRLPGNALAAALDDLPLPPHAWASSSLQCFSYGPASPGCEAHVDKRLLTLVYAPGQPGLQVQAAAGAWADVPLGRNQLLVLAGHSLEHATCGLLRASSHRVVLGQGEERRSLTYKLALHPAAAINLLPALQAAGHGLGQAAQRYPQPTTGAEVLARFDATHRSANPPRQAAQGAPGAAGGAAGAGAAAAAAGAAAGAGGAAAAGAGQGAPPLVQDEDPAGFLTLRFINQAGANTLVRLRPATPLAAAFRAVCDRHGLEEDGVVFVYDTNRLNPSQTPAHYGMEHMDSVEFYPHQLGD